jgi:hypothetical protein
VTIAADMPAQDRGRYPGLRNAAIVSLFLIPGLVGSAQHFFGPQHYWFRNFEAVACAAQRWAQGMAMYGPEHSCPGMRPSTYVYPPAAARAMAAAIEAMGQTGATALYGGLFWAAAGFLLWAAAFASTAPGTMRDRAPFLAMYSGAALYWGNIAIPVHGAVAAVAVLLAGVPLALVAAIAISAMIKPVYLTYAVVLLYAAHPPVRRLGYAAAAALLGLAPTVWFMVTGGDAVRQWQSSMADFVLSRQPGNSFFGWVTTFGGSPGAAGTMILYVVFAGLLAGAGIVIAEAARLPARDRIWLGLTVANLLNPRLMPYDVLLLGPGMVVAVASLRDWSPRLARHLWHFLVGACVGVLLMTLLGGRIGQKIGFLAFAATLIVIAAAHLRAAIGRRGETRLA